MSDVIIKAENLGKKYVIGHQAENGRYVALRDVLMHNVHSMWDKTKDLMRGNAIVQGDSLEELWALRDINFEIRQGDVVGIIGRNGAGKSTLLKILSRITEPTEGRVRIQGRVASLLEVGTGFHTELTGRENIFLNGAILGMSRAEMRSKFDEIVAFAEVEKFLDTPVKRYSSGMYVRLAFAVAAHLEPKILIVDEVLAVGDAEFQRKCLGKMEHVSKTGRTVLFVSHNMAAVGALCRTGFVLDGGKLVCAGEMDKCLDYYQSNSRIQASAHLAERNNRQGSGLAKCLNVSVIGSDGQFLTTIRSGDKFEVLFEIESKRKIDHVLPGLNITNSIGQRVVTFWGGFTDRALRLEPGINHFLLRARRLDLRPGEYRLSATLGLDGEALDIVEDILEVNVSAPAGWSPARYPTLDHGPLFPEFEWTEI